MIIRETKSMTQTERMESRNSNFLYQDRELKEHISQNKATPHIIESGKNGIWSYRKWSNGVAECWGEINFPTVALDSLWDTFHYTSLTASLPSGLFIEKPNYCNVVSAWDSIMFAVPQSEANTSDTVKFAAVRLGTNAETFQNVPFAIHAIGRWTEEIAPGDYDDIPVVDQTYNPASENAQSGTAVAEAVESETTRADNTYANALKGISSGEAAAMNDVSPVSHEMGVKVRGKNLLSNITEQSNYGVELTEYGDAYVLNGTCTQSANFSFAQSNLQAGTYTLSSLKSINLPNVTYALLQLILTPLDGGENVNVNVNNHNVENKGVSFTIDKEYKCQLRIRVQQGVTYDDYYLYPQLELGTAATAYAPYISDYTAVKVKKSGKNLFDINAVFNTPADKYEITGDRLRVYANRAYDAGCMYRIYLPVGTTYTVKYDVEYGGTAERVYNEIGGYQITGSPSEVLRTYTVPALGYVQLEFARLGGGNDKLGWVDFSNIQLETGSTATDYIPYIVAEYTPNSDGTVEGVTSLYPATTLMTDTAGAIIDCEYNRDINKAYGELLKRISALETAAVNNA